MDCQSLNKLGLFPGPEETKEEFQERVRLLKNVKDEEHEKPREIVSKLFGCAPNWVPIAYSNKGLSLWEGAATWIEKGSVRIQLKTGFKKGIYLRLYRRDEVLAHELVHLCRMAFDEIRFEEIFAYQTSKAKFRRLFGALFRRPAESLVFVVTAFFPLLAIVTASSQLFPLLWSIPVLYFAVLTARLARSQRTLSRCLRTLSKVVKNPLAFALRLTDAEIARFARAKPEEIQAYMQAEPSFRWQFLRQT